MKLIILIFLLVIFTNSFAQNDSTFFVQTNVFFKTYITDNKVDYKAIKNNILDLDYLINHIATQNYERDNEKAYLINAYNLLVINKVVKYYPIKSPNDVQSFFDEKDHIINHQLYSLNDIENKLLREKFNDYRLHFVLVCGAVSCPPISNFSYLPNQLNEQLNTQTKRALNNPQFVYQNSEDKTIYLSEIFKWYQSDFGKNNKEIINLINQYRTQPFNTTYNVKYYNYNWQLNDLEIQEKSDNEKSNQTITAGSLYKKKQFDLTAFNTIYTENYSNWKGEYFSGFRNTFVTHLFQFTYGISKSGRFNIGLDVNFKYSGTSIDSTLIGISSAYNFKNTSTSRIGITSLGLRLKFQPFKKIKNFTFQSTFLAPTIKLPEGNSNLYWADWARFTVWNQFFYTKSFNSKLQLFLEADLLLRLKIYGNQINMLDVPLSVFLSYFPNKKITFYVMSQHLNRFAKPNEPNDWVIPSNYTLSGLGFKYQITHNLNLELLYNNFWRAKNAGLGNTLNIGIKYISN
jgi:hypothetical protein